MILFFDIDGVLHPKSALKEANVPEDDALRVLFGGLSHLPAAAWDNYILPGKMELLETIVEQTPNAKIVAASAWRDNFYEKMMSKLSDKIKSALVDCTPTLPFSAGSGQPNGHRDVEQQIWMAKNRPNDQCLALDDNARLFYEGAALHVVNGETGLVAADVPEILSKIEQEMHRPIEEIVERRNQIFERHKRYFGMLDENHPCRPDFKRPGGPFAPYQG